ncbi:PREDICTED: DNA (cytosine-5)-methyltransferase 3-like [Gekko japonicus]|uniref:DNA (Cytosine-5)-methyltransferase 3-like n=1 Tax=Gekko japonicus TaxID=146911 RepID=A0ABM1JUW7_GEKJA|nr:PREDICTED: DNA (cytosine-5)-methyltransferase 3-like [Gekko japonicus]
MAGEVPVAIVVDSDSSIEEISSTWGTAPSCEVSSNSDVISVSTMEQIPPATPLRPSTENLAYEVINKKRNIEEICICCGSCEIHAQHPLFHGGICAPCTERFLEKFFLCDDDGYEADCAICCLGESLVMCDDPGCIRSFCTKCLNELVGQGTAEEVRKISPWICFLCLPFHVHGVLKKRTNWRTELKFFYDQESNLWIYQPLSPWERKSINVLSLFDNITQELKCFGFLGKSTGNGRVKYLHDVTDVVRTHIEEWGPFDVVFGSTPALGNSYEHPPAWYIYQYVRILQYSRPPERSRPFFWIFLDNLVLEEETRDAACRFLKTDATMRIKLDKSTIQNVVHIWSNIPSVNSKYSGASLYVDLFKLAKDICRKRIFSERPATLIKEFFVPLKEYFRTF